MMEGKGRRGKSEKEEKKEEKAGEARGSEETQGCLYLMLSPPPPYSRYD